MALTDHKLRFVIDADGKAARRELVDIDNLIGRMGSGLGSLAGPAAAAATGVGLIGAAAAGGAAALFTLTKQAAAYGSEIYNASVKTGLGAETISALKLSADRTGVSLESVGTIVGRFSKQVGEAAQGSKEAKENLTRLGIDPQKAINDLDGALAQAVKRIYEMESPIARATAAQQLFGKAGTELLKVLDDAKGDLPGLIAEAKRLGVTLSDEDAKAADEFGDQMDILNAQIGAATRSIGQAFMPVFLDMAKGVSTWLTDNKDEIESWGRQQADTLRGLISLWNDFHAAAAGDRSNYRVNAAGEREYLNLSTIFSGAAGAYLRDRGTAARMAGAGSAFGDAGGTGYELDPVTNTLRARTGATRPPDNSYLSDRGGGRGSARRTASGDAMRKFFEDELGAVVTSFRRRPGALVAGTNRISKHGSGEAVDIRTKDRTIEDIFTITAKAIEKGYRLVDERNKKDQPHQHYEANSRRASEFLAAATYGGADRLAYLQKLDAERLGKATGETSFQKFTEEGRDKQKRENEETLSIIRDGVNQEIELYESRAETKLAIMERDAAAMMLTEEQLADRRLKTEEEVSEFKIKKLEEFAELFEVDSRERARITQEVALELESIEQKRAKRDADRHAAEQKRLQEKRESWKKYVEAIKAATAAQDEEEAEQGRRRYEAGTVMGGTGIGGAIARGLGVELVPMFDEATNAMITFQERMALVSADINDFVGNAIGGLIDGLSQMAAAWLVTGEFSAKAALQMAAGAALGIAMQAGVKAIFEYAEAAAAAARYDFFAAAAHTAAAKLYLKTAVIAGAIGVGLGLAGRAVGGGESGGRAGGSTGSSTTGRREEDLRPISRASDDVYISGRRSEARFVADAVRELTKKIDSMKPGDVLVAGARQKKGFVGSQAVTDINSNAAIGNKLARSMNIK